METVDHLLVKFRQVKHILLLALCQKMDTGRKEAFCFAVEYHKATIRMSEMVNEPLEFGTFVHIFLTAGLLGCTSYRLIKSISLGGMCLFASSILLSIVLLCYFREGLMMME
ncbi:unnamed protein product [Phaedon cochleariae]|uniref:Uncharacterized protein n=1 Tax=Phaedon cochleariae TaxID=80249 RepID=A0A9N9SDT9_PHACE|nr:unnamed protein product [Phaedon cochleariae]